MNELEKLQAENKLLSERLHIFEHRTGRSVWKRDVGALGDYLRVAFNKNGSLRYSGAVRERINSITSSPKHRFMSSHDQGIVTILQTELINSNDAVGFRY